LINFGERKIVTSEKMYQGAFHLERRGDVVENVEREGREGASTRGSEMEA